MSIESFTTEREREQLLYIEIAAIYQLENNFVLIK